MAIDSSGPDESPKAAPLRTVAVKGTSWSVIESAAGQGLSVLIFLLLARLLTPRDFGIVAIANVYILVAQFLVFQGLGQAILQFEDLNDEHLDTIFWFNLGAGLLLFAVTFGIAGPMAGWFREPLLANVLRALAPVLILAALTDVQNNLLTRRMRFRSLAVRTFASYAVGGVVSIVVALRGGGPWSLVAQQVTVWGVNLLVLWTASEWRPRWRFSVGHARRLLGFGVHLLYVDLVGLSNRRADQLFIGRVLGTVSAGFYSVGARLAMLVSEVLIRSLSRVSTTVLSRLQTETERMRRAVYEIAEMQSAVILPLTVGLALVTPELIGIVFGTKWASAIPIMQVLLLACPLEALSAVHQSALVARGQPKWCSALTTAHAVVNVTLIAVAVRWGVVAVAAAYALRTLALYPVELAVLRRVADFSPVRFLRALAPQVAAVLLMAAAVWLARRSAGAASAPILLAVSVLAGVASYGVALTLLNRKVVNEFWRYRSLLSPRAATAGAIG